MKIQDKIVLITGGASGIGRIMGEMALKKGASALVIWDINQANIDATISELNVLLLVMMPAQLMRMSTSPTSLFTLA